MEELLARHASEIAQMKENSTLLLKSSKKSQRAAVEAQIIQKEFDLKAKHREEIEEFEESCGGLTKESHTITSCAVNAEYEQSQEEIKQAQILAKKAKNQKKKDKKVEKETQRLSQLHDIRANSGPSLREVELKAINDRLKPDGLTVKEVLSDGNCLYRAFADQLIFFDPNDHIFHSCIKSTTSAPTSMSQSFGATRLPVDHTLVRKIAAEYMRQHADTFTPFLGLSETDPEYSDYCSRVEDVITAEWGGQLEIRALCNALQRVVLVYEATAPVLRMEPEHIIDGSESCGSPIYLTYHRHYYALGEHYNSVTKLVNS